MSAQSMRLGPERRHWIGPDPEGYCPDCGGQCAPDCGQHPAGCIYGGEGWAPEGMDASASGYWMIAEGCPYFHGDEPTYAAPPFDVWRWIHHPIIRILAGAEEEIVREYTTAIVEAAETAIAQLQYQAFRAACQTEPGGEDWR